MIKNDNSKQPSLFVLLTGLAVLLLLVYAQVYQFDFINFDDWAYVYKHPSLKGGISWEGMKRAFTDVTAANWHPLTMISFLFDYQLYGAEPGGYHIVNVLWHLANTLLLFWVVYRYTGWRWRSGFIAALFAVHPMHVESVAWISERKDVLCVFFGLAALLSYRNYAQSLHRRYLYQGALFHLLSLSAKPMLVTLPFILLLLDYWPLQRLSPIFPLNKEKRVTLKKLVVEKWLFFLLAIVFSVITFAIQKSSGAFSPADVKPVQTRVPNAVVSYVLYLWKTLWPASLGVYYPHPINSLTAVQVLSSLALLIFIFWIAVRYREKYPWFLFGWLWFFGSLIPVIGIVQVGGQAMADRYVYWPHIGLFIIFAAGLSTVPLCWKKASKAIVYGSVAILLVLALQCKRQLEYWRNSETLWKHTISVTTKNPRAHAILGSYYQDQNRWQDAINAFDQAIALNPRYAEHYAEKGYALMKLGRTTEAKECFNSVLQLNPDHGDALNNMGFILHAQGQVEQALSYFYRAAEHITDKAPTFNNMAVMYEGMGQLDSAAVLYDKAIRLNPDYDDALKNYADLLLKMGKIDSARQLAQRLSQSTSAAPAARVLLGRAAMMQGDLPDALAQFSRCLDQEPNNQEARLLRARVYLLSGQIEAAKADVQTLLHINPKHEQAHALLAEIKAHIGTIRASSFLPAVQ